MTTVVVDGDGFLGYMPTMIATAKAIDKARQVGVGMGLIRHIGHYGAAGHYTRMCTDAGCVGFSVQGLPASGSSPGEGPKPSVAFTGLPPMSSRRGSSRRKRIATFAKPASRSRRCPGYDEVMLPGHVEERVMARHRTEGIRFGEIEQKVATEMSEYLDVPLPWSV